MFKISYYFSYLFFMMQKIMLELNQNTASEEIKTEITDKIINLQKINNLSDEHLVNLLSAETKQ